MIEIATATIFTLVALIGDEREHTEVELMDFESKAECLSVAEDRQKYNVWPDVMYVCAEWSRV